MAKSILHHSRLVSGITLISRISGLARDILIAGWLGNNWIQDCFNYGFRIPNLFRNLLGEGALAAAFVPVLSEKLTDPDRGGARKLFCVVASTLAVILISLTLLILILIACIYWFGQSSRERMLVLGLTAVMVPYMIFVCLVALFSAMLNCLDRFRLATFMSVILNLFQIAAMICAPILLKPVWPLPEEQIYLGALSVILAGVVQLALMIRAAKNLGLPWQFRLDWKHPDLRRIAATAGPMFVGLGILQFGAWLDDQIIFTLTAIDRPSFHILGYTIDYPLVEGTLSAVNQARRLYQFPLGVLAISLATVAFPTFSRLAAQKDYPGLASSITHAFRLAIFEAIPSSVGLIVLAPWIVKVILERGSFTPEDTAQTAHILRFYSLGIWAYCSHHIVVRVFYSLKDTITPLKIMAKTISLAILLDMILLWIPSIRAGAFGLSTSIMASLNVIFLSRILSQRIAAFELRPILYCAAQTALASILMGAAGFLVCTYIPIRSKYLLLLLSISVSGIVFFVACRLLRIPEANELLSLARSRKT